MRPWWFYRKGEIWIGKVGIFWGRIAGIELPNGNFYGKWFR